MKYPIGPETLAHFRRVKVKVSDKVVRDFQQSNSALKRFHVLRDINVINSNALIPMVIIERPNDADRALEALNMNGSTSKKTAVKTKPMKAKPTKQTNAKKPPQKKQKTSRPLFVLPKLNKTERDKKN